MSTEFKCGLIKTETLDGIDYDCEYEFAGEITCEECIYNNGKFDPRQPRYRSILASMKSSGISTLEQQQRFADYCNNLDLSKFRIVKIKKEN
jgi:hypothetical protein